MALQPCRECRHDVSTEASNCPHCGAPRPTEQSTSSTPRAEPRRVVIDQAQDPSPPSTVAVVVGWIIGSLLVLVALGALVRDPLAGVLYLLAAGVVLPPANRWLKERFSIALSWKVKTGLVLGLIVASGIAASMRQSTSPAEDREAAGAAETRRTALRADYEANSTRILRQMDSAYKAGNYGFAILIGQKYREAVSDSQLLRRLRVAHGAQKREADRARERDLLAQVAAMPTSNVEGRRSIYAQLVALNPSNASYRTRFDDYNKRVRQEQAAAQDRIRRFGPTPEASAWDGTYREVKDYLRANMNDPSSLEGLECTKVYHVERGWLVGCNYRGRNAFGGMIRTANWFIIRNGLVVEVLPFSAYNP